MQLANATLDEFTVRRAAIVGGLNALPGVRCLEPDGAFYAFPNITATGFGSRDLADRLLEEAGVPGHEIGFWVGALVPDGTPQEIVARFHGRPAAEHALAEFEARFKQGALPETMPEVTLRTNGAGMPIAQLAKQAGIVESTSEALRLIAQRGLKLDGDVVTDKSLIVTPGATVVVQAGKRKFARVTVQ